MGAFNVTGSPTINGDGTVTLSGTAELACPEAQALLDESVGFFAACFRPSWASTGSIPNTSPGLFFWGDSTFVDRMTVLCSNASTIGLLKANGTSVSCNQGGTWAANDPVTVVVTWTATEIRCSVQGQTFNITADTSVLSFANPNFNVGSWTALGNRPIASPVAWAIAGLGTLTQTDVNTLNSLGLTNPTFITLPTVAQTSFIWTCDDFNYLTRPYVQIIDDPQYYFGPF